MVALVLSNCQLGHLQIGVKILFLSSSLATLKNQDGMGEKEKGWEEFLKNCKLLKDSLCNNENCMLLLQPDRESFCEVASAAPL